MRLTTVLFALFVSTCVVEGQEPKKNPRALVLEAHRSRDAAALRALALRDSPDPWYVVEDLCRLGEYDAAAAFAKAAPRSDTEKLPEYVAARRTDSAGEDTNRALNESNRLLRAAKPGDALAVIDRANPDGADVVSVLLLAQRGAALQRLRRLQESAKAFAVAGEAAKRLGWLSYAAYNLESAALAARDASDPAAAVAFLQRKLVIEDSRKSVEGRANTLLLSGGQQVFLGDYRGAVSGGEPEQLTELGESEIDHRWPQVLPDNRHLLFTAAVDQRLEPRILDLTTGRVVPIDVQGSFARFVAGGYLIYMKTNTLWAIRIDIESGKTTGKQVPVASGIHESSLGIPYFAVSTAGVLLHEPTRPPSLGQGLVWVDRKGVSTSLDTGKGYEFPRISPDGRSVVFANHKPSSTHDVWILDLEQGGTTPIASDGNFVSPNWSDDGDVLVFSEFVWMNLYTRRLNESASQPLLRRDGAQWPLQWLKSGRLLLQEQLPGRTWDLMEFDPSDGDIHPLIASGNSETAGTVSANGRWIAYVSDQSGQGEVYVQSYPAGRKIRISESGGKEPRWSPTGKELFFRRGPGLFAVDVPQDDGGHFGKPRLLFEGPFVEGFATVANYDVAPDGNRFVMVDGGQGLTAGRLDVHLNLARELELALSGSR